MLSVKFKVMKLKLLPVLAIASSSTDQFCRAQSMVQYAQPMAGSGVVTTPAAFKYGSYFALFANTIPMVITPFAMTLWTPQTQTSENKCMPPPYYKDDLFSGIRGSH